MSIIVNSLKSKSIRTRPHISLKLRKRLPSWTYFYSSTTIISVSIIVRIFTTVAHVLPHGIQRIVFNQHGILPNERLIVPCALMEGGN